MSERDPATPVDGLPLGGPGDRPVRRRRGPGTPVVLLALLVAAVAGVGLGAVLAQRDAGPGTTGGGGASEGPGGAVIEPASVTSYDPVGGSGLAEDGDGTWSTQTYTTASFGNLKPGVGLLLDLGESREVSSVTVDPATPGLDVELLAGDDAPSEGTGDDGVGAMVQADSATTSDGATMLSGADAGSHRYWMLWVTQLAPVGGGFAADVGTPVVEGPPS